ncbi:MAG TPA: hypothetical protein VIF15_22590 [Polyangiaceae bacterium]|jgi:hypothetical protein
MRSVLAAAASSLSLLSLLGACGGAPAVSGTRASGQSALMNDTFAGQNRCNPRDQARPFVVEWDATDTSSFESRAQSDVVFVRYEGCDLTILDGCAQDSVPGELGAYKPVDWTSGQLETVDVGNEADLYAKLPLGVASLGGRVRAGEKFHMEYFVSGTRIATRSAVDRGALAKIPGCRGATHFVYAYNLGAFALGSASNVQGEVGGSVYGFGTGGSTSSSHKAEKHGGDLASCKAETAREVQSCRAPIRLTLRPIGDGTETADAPGPDAPASGAKVDRIDAQLEATRRSNAHYESAHTRLLARDGGGCVTEMDAGDRQSGSERSLDPRGLLKERATCVMLAGQCDTGKKQLRAALEKLLDPDVDGSPAQIDKKVDEYAATYCQGAGTSPRDQLLGALKTLYRGAFDTRLDVAVCRQALDTVEKQIGVVKPRNKDDEVSFGPAQAFNYAPRCMVRAGDCKAAFEAHLESSRLLTPPMADSTARASFGAIYGECKGSY